MPGFWLWPVAFLVLASPPPRFMGRRRPPTPSLGTLTLLSLLGLAACQSLHSLLLSLPLFLLDSVLLPVLSLLFGATLFARLTPTPRLLSTYLFLVCHSFLDELYFHARLSQLPSLPAGAICISPVVRHPRHTTGCFLFPGCSST